MLIYQEHCDACRHRSVPGPFMLAWWLQNTVL